MAGGNSSQTRAGAFSGSCVALARGLLGKILYRRSPEGRAGGKIVEVEAYLGRRDPACHTAKGYTPRTRPFLLGAGTMYVYRTRQHSCFNIVTQAPREGHAILIRALEPTLGLKLMARRRGLKDPLRLARGPGNLCVALAISAASSGKKLGQDGIGIRAGKGPVGKILATARIGVTQARSRRLRFILAGSPYVSGRKR